MSQSQHHGVAAESPEGSESAPTASESSEARGPERGRWTPGRIAAVAAALLVAAFLLVKAADDPRRFAVVTLNGLTLAALFFVVASGFTLIFGLMRVVNMAHGSLYLLGGYLALRMQESWFKDDSGLGLSLSGASDTEYGLAGWLVPLIVATLIIGLVGVAMQQVFLRWNH